ncbi:MAG TPA: MBL fold metallo-hydrolase, partial [Kiritimatiellia bacterium]|nr:MBL fold metallo-hydrolase [Kiritimatiellia bacterium]
MALFQTLKTAAGVWNPLLWLIALAVAIGIGLYIRSRGRADSRQGPAREPFISGNPLAANVDIDRIRADYILVSHGHEDHMGDVERMVSHTGAKLISNYEITVWFAARGVSNSHALNHGGAWTFDFGRVKYVSAVHSSMLPDGANGGNAGGFVVQTNEGSFYYSGDTALTLDMKLIG